MVTRADILRETARWEGTPVRPKQCCRGRGVDCKMLPAGVARALGMPEGDSIAARTINYRRSFNGQRMLDGLEKTLIRTFDPKPADLVAIIMGDEEDLPRHLGIITKDGWMMHAYGGGVGFVREVPYHRRRIHSYWTWPSLNKAQVDG